MKRGSVSVILLLMAATYPGAAVISACGVYRHELTREINANNRRMLVVIGLNPSTATADEDDPTIRKEVKYALRWNCGLLLKVNAYDFRATKPSALFRAAKQGTRISSTQNDSFIARAIERARASNGIVLVAWGKNIKAARQAELAEVVGSAAMCLGTNSDGSPVHPLYQKDDATPIRWALPR